MSLENLDEYILEFQNYKEGNYKFGNYWTKEQILDEFSKGKIFVLKGGLRIGDWTFTILMFAIGLITGTILSFFYIGLGVFMFCFWLFFGSISFIKLRHLLVIGPLGVFYRKIFNSGVFSWNNVLKIEGRIVTYFFRLPLTTAEVKVILMTRKKKRFASHLYLNKEFSKKVHREMFINLFYIYYKLGQNKTPKGTSYTSYTCKLCGFKLTTEAEFCPKCGLRIMLS
ncbi:hypothetical protein ES705_23987 [subsurface metagenome]